MEPEIETMHPTQHAPRWWWNIREIILGANDGLVSTLAFVAGASASLADPDLIAIATSVEVIAGAISMGFGAFLGTRSQAELERRELAVERHHLRVRRHEELVEFSRYLRRYSLKKSEIDQILQIIGNNEPLLLSLMGGLELRTQRGGGSSARDGLAMGTAFIVGAMPAALPFFLIEEPGWALLTAITASVLFLVIVGTWRARVGRTPLRRRIGEMVAVGVFATAAGYASGHLVMLLLG